MVGDLMVKKKGEKLNQVKLFNCIIQVLGPVLADMPVSFA